MDLARYLKRLEDKGARWKAIRRSEKLLNDTIECTTIIRVEGGLIRGVVETFRLDDISRVKAEVTYYVEGELDKEGNFKHSKHPKDKRDKLFEYNDQVLFRYRTMLGIKLGWEAATPISVEHRHLVEMANLLVADFDKARKDRDEIRETQKTVRQTDHKEKGNRALFG